MPLNLPTTIENYFLSEKTDAIEFLGDFFANHAVVRDESASHHGLDAIKAWKTKGKLTTGYMVEPQSVLQRDDQTVVSALVSGRFPGSPVRLTYRFRLVSERIVELEIG